MFLDNVSPEHQDSPGSVPLFPDTQPSICIKGLFFKPRTFLCTYLCQCIDRILLELSLYGSFFIWLCIFERQRLKINLSPSMYHGAWHFISAQKYLLNPFIVGCFPRLQSPTFHIWSTCRACSHYTKYTFQNIAGKIVMGSEVK